MEVIYNIWDREITHCSNLKEAGLRCGVRNNAALIDYKQDVVWKKKDKFADVTFFTDRCLSFDIIDKVQSNTKIGWLMESRTYHPDSYNIVETVEDKLDFIFTHDDYLLSKDPNKYKFLAADWVGIEKESHNVHTKKNLISMIYSNKSSLDRMLRRHVAEKFKNKINLFGTGSPSGVLYIKSFSLNSYCFSVAMENNIADNYYTEKIIDCFITGNIPIYRGCNNIGDFFDKRGIITFNKIDELEDILNNISFSMYMDMLPYVKTNFELAKRYIDPDNLIRDFLVAIKKDISYNTREYFKYNEDP
jgi:hypothetical protein